MVSSALLLVVHLSVAQAATDFPPPPLVPATPSPQQVPPPPPMPPPEPSTAAPGTPPPPTLVPQGQPSPYGAAKPVAEEKPPVEWGLMISEGLFGMLTAAGVSLLPYFLLLRPVVEGTPGGGVFGNEATVGTIIYLILFAAIPLSTAQTEVSIANGSRWYYSETWPAALCGLAAEGAVLGLAYLTRGPKLTEPGPLANPYVLLVGTIAFTPLVQMAVINLFKSPRFGKPGSGGTALLNYREGRGLSVGIPQLAPIFSSSRDGALSGVQFSLLSGRW